MGRTTSTLPQQRPAKNAFNERERMHADMAKTLESFDTSLEAQVRKGQKLGTTLIGWDRNGPAQTLGPTKRA